MPAETAASVIHSPEQAEPGIDRDHHDGGSLLRSLPGDAFSAVVDALQTPGGDRVECAPWLKTALLRQMRPSPPSGRSCSAGKGRPSPWEERPKCSVNALSPRCLCKRTAGGPWPPPGWAPSAIGTRKLCWFSQLRRWRHADTNIRRSSDGLDDAVLLHRLWLGFRAAHLVVDQWGRPWGFEHGPDDRAAVVGG